MSQLKLTEIPAIALINTGSLAYIVDSSQSFRGTIDQLAQKLISSYGLFANPLSAGTMTSGNAEILLQGLNNAPNAVLSASRIDFSSISIGDIDGGNFSDTFINVVNSDGGTF